MQKGIATTFSITKPIQNALATLAKVTRVDGGEGAYDSILDTLIANIMGMEVSEFDLVYEWTQNWFSDAVCIYYK